MPAVMLGVFALTLFCSASLLFLLEPMVGKMMLPLLGGTPAVWNTCMVFFQAILLAGYAFAHWSTQKLGPRRQARLQMVVLVLPFLSFVLNAALLSGALTPAEKLILGREGNPIPALLLVLTITVGLPMFVVCTTAPLLQRWFSSTDHPSARDPYFLYGASNLGSMLTLLAYPTIVEPNLDLEAQKAVVMVAFGVLAGLTALCAFLMWGAAPAQPALVGATASVGATEVPASTAIKSANRDKVRARKEEWADDNAAAGPVEYPVTWLRRLRWIALAAVPSSLMLGVTTYMTTDIAAIPLLWIPPLALYLMTFIIVFQKMTPQVQARGLIVAAGLLVLLVVWKVAPMYFKDDPETGNPTLLWLVRLAGVGLFILSFQLRKMKDPQLVHHVMIMIMPLLVLLILFMMLSEIKPGTVLNICLHLLTLLIVSMVCHGELARDRPGPSGLTEFFLLMSIGGVVGGLFNGLLAPVIFNSHLEYPLMLMVACLLLPPLGLSRDSVWARRADLALGSIFLILGVALLVLFFNDEGVQPPRESLKAVPWGWVGFATVGGLLLGGWAASKNFGVAPAEPGALEEEDKTDRVLDLVLPLCLMILAAGLIWGLPTAAIKGRLGWLASKVRLRPDDLITVLSYGLPAVLCYTFVERGLRFGLGVGGLLLVCGVSGVLKDPPLYQDRSFFGVLKVEDRSYDIPTGKTFGALDYDPERMYRYRRLLHGTTLHGEQFLDDGVREVPLSYYHRTGPAGRVFRAYNNDPKRPFAVIGLGTGTMACYGLKGQRVDFFDIDPVVVEISYDTNEYFTFIEDAEARGVDVNLILGDARLTFQPTGERPRLKPMHRRSGQPKPSRAFGPNLTPQEQYRLIVVDAFSSDAIPIHLITREAIEIYLDRLADDGILCIHISNRYLDLHPVLANITQKIRQDGTRAGKSMPELCAYHMSDDDDGPPGKNRSHWVAITRRKENMAKVLQVPNHETRWERDPAQLKLVGLMCWPGTSPGMQLVQGVANYCRNEIDKSRVEEERKTGQPFYRVEWKPAEDSEEQQRQLDEIKGMWEKMLGPKHPWTATIDSKDLAGDLAPLTDHLMKEYQRLKGLDKVDDDKIERASELWRALSGPADDADTVLTFTRKELEEIERDLPKEKDAEKLTSLRNRIKKLDLLLVGARRRAVAALASEEVRRAEEELDKIRKQLADETKEDAQAKLRKQQQEVEKRRDDAKQTVDDLKKDEPSKPREELEKLEKGKDAAATAKATTALLAKVKEEVKKTEKALQDLQPRRQAADSLFAYALSESHRLTRQIGQVRRQYNLVDDLPGKIKKYSKVGVWTDGYSNILRVFSW